MLHDIAFPLTTEKWKKLRDKKEKIPAEIHAEEI